jgi:hypothetical protein
MADARYLQTTVPLIMVYGIYQVCHKISDVSRKMTEKNLLAQIPLLAVSANVSLQSLYLANS